MAIDGKRKLAIILGGKSAERDVSIMTGMAVYEVLERTGLFFIKKFDPKLDPLQKLIDFDPFVVFNALHGRYGEDGYMQGFLEVLGIPYTGAGVLGCALSMNKWTTKKILMAYGYPVPKALYITKNTNFDLTKAIKEHGIGFPAIVKPNDEGSSVRVSLVSSNVELLKGVENVFTYGKDALIEEFIEGKEVQVAILGNRNLGSVEIIPDNAFYDYEAKYMPGKSKHLIPPRIDRGILEVIEDLAKKTHRALDLYPLSRIDFKIHPENGPFILEANALPGLTKTSLVPEIARHAGISFEKLSVLLIEYALNKVGKTLDYGIATY